MCLGFISNLSSTKSTNRPEVLFFKPRYDDIVYFLTESTIEQKVESTRNSITLHKKLQINLNYKLAYPDRDNGTI